MKEESLSESAAIVKIFKHFFDASVETKAPDAAKEKDEAMVALRVPPLAKPLAEKASPTLKRT